MWQYNYTDVGHNELYHYGRKGMKWYQNIYTKGKNVFTARKARKQEREAAKNEALKKKKDPVAAAREKALSEAEQLAKRKRDIIQNGNPREVFKNAHLLTTEELNEAKQRIELKSSIDKKKGEEFINKLESVKKTSDLGIDIYNNVARTLTAFTGKEVPVVGKTDAVWGNQTKLRKEAKEKAEAELVKDRLKEAAKEVAEADSELNPSSKGKKSKNIDDGDDTVSSNKPKSTDDAAYTPTNKPSNASDAPTSKPKSTDSDSDDYGDRAWKEATKGRTTDDYRAIREALTDKAYDDATKDLDTNKLRERVANARDAHDKRMADIHKQAGDPDDYGDKALDEATKDLDTKSLRDRVYNAGNRAYDEATKGLDTKSLRERMANANAKQKDRLKKELKEATDEFYDEVTKDYDSGSYRERLNALKNKARNAADTVYKDALRREIDRDLSEMARDMERETRKIRREAKTYKEPTTERVIDWRDGKAKTKTRAAVDTLIRGFKDGSKQLVKQEREKSAIERETRDINRDLSKTTRDMDRETKKYRSEPVSRLTDQDRSIDWSSARQNYSNPYDLPSSSVNEIADWFAATF